jgi:exodeoxyribonuclease V beta subunit
MKQHVFIESYSSLKDRATSTTLGDMESEPPARDHASADVSSALRDPESEPTARDHASYDSPGGSTKEHTIYTFPKGAHTGTFWHHIFEHIDFTDPAGFEPEIHRACEMFGFNADTWDQVLRGMVHHVVDTDLDRFRLADVPPSRALPEMEFYLPYADDAMNKFLQWIITQMHDENPEVVSAETGTQAAPDREDLRHYLTGFIDLLVEHNGKYYIIDYKSDYLGDTPEAYAGPALLTHMREKRYVMQYYVYALALYLFLRNRLGDFDFDAVFGGVFYLFLRGMDGRGGQGVFSDRPDPRQIVAFAGHLQAGISGGER